MEGMADAAGHADRHTPLKNYYTGLLLPGKRTSVELMAARLAPDNVRRTHQSLHHLVADAPWNDEAMLVAVRRVAPFSEHKSRFAARKFRVQFTTLILAHGSHFWQPREVNSAE
jgi:SRSO17 transposase